MLKKQKNRGRGSMALLCAAAMLLCPLATGADTPEVLRADDPQADYVQQTPIRKMNSYVEDGMIRVKDLEKVARDYEKVPAEFLWEIDGRDEISVDRFEKYALEFQLPAQYVQRFIDDYFVFKQGNTYQYIPVDESLSYHSYDWDNLVHDDWSGEKEYIVDTERRAVKVIDVSVHQGNIDWESVKADGVDYAFIRLGYRGYTKGEIFLDDKYERNMQKAQEAGVKVGVYFYSQAVSRQEAIEEARFVLDNIRGYNLDLPVVFDIEGAQNSHYRTSGMSVQTATNIVTAFCDTIENAGYDTMLYSYCKFLVEQLDLSQLQQYDLWLAQYYHVPFFPYNFQIWQYDYEGQVAGISRGVDVNLMFLDYEPSVVE